ncbi:hypothetical protein JD844_021360 [Phrynosoma platyrhinos]|uniref:Uncharacterized protein n=1 Tax=Phrynosoma platyrhinos TaxID=52577 RepID=A0ABQ7STE3_PHRPL|nr:hypothetical protein JD844_021360 [Phrynosoma platyrhinos]
MKIPDTGAVEDGTPCGKDMMCIGGECLEVSLLNYDCNFTKCHNRGICNSRRHCHCDHGWAPPDCLNEGYGGSIDSGPASKDRSAIIAGTVDPRKNNSVCDLPEYCQGTSEWCPEDVYVQDGAPCRDGAYCYQGNCTTHDEQCKMIFGSKATVASDDCFRIINAQGDRFGNCGLNHGFYSKCNTLNILCGRLQCDNVDDLPSLEEHSTIIQSYAGSKECWGFDYHTGVKIPDTRTVGDGTPCGKDMMCIGGECLEVSLLNYDCNFTKCHNRVICNSRKHCHCDHGWAPPDCLNKGYGGSIDSGPASEDGSAIIAKTVEGTLFVLSSAMMAFVLVRELIAALAHSQEELARRVGDLERTLDQVKMWVQHFQANRSPPRQ